MKDKKDEFKIFQPLEYQTEMKSLGPDGRFHYLVYNSEADKYAYVFNKKYTEDASFYSPYLVHKIGKKIGINVPSTELGLYLEKDIDTGNYRDSFYETSLVYLDGMSKFSRFSRDFSYADPEVVQAIYLSEDEKGAQERREKAFGNAIPITIDEYVMSNLHFITTRGNKSKQEFSEQEIEDIKQELIDRAMFGLKFGIHGKNSIVMYGHKNAKLDNYYLSSSNMFSFNVRTEWIEEQLKKDDDEFKKAIDLEYRPQYGLLPNISEPTNKQLLDYIYAKYPKQAEKAYKKISSYTEQDLKEELSTYTRLEDSRKEYALRVFKAKEKEFNESYKNHLKNKEQEIR